MSDKDQFIFEDDDFPKTDLGDEKEPLVAEPGDENEPLGLDLGDEDEPLETDLLDEGFPEVSRDDQDESLKLDLGYADDLPETELDTSFVDDEPDAEEMDLDEFDLGTKSGGNSKARILLMVLLLIVAGAAGAYYFMGLGETTPATPKVAVPAQKTTKSVALPSPPADGPSKAEPATQPVTVAVPPPPPVEQADAAPVEPSKTETTDQVAAVVKPEEKLVAERPKVEPTQQPEAKAVVSESQIAQDETKAAPASTLVPDSSASASVEPTKAVVASRQVVGGAFTLDAGSYLLESNRTSLVAKIKKLGYEPLVTPVDATLDMTRLRLGTFDKDKVQETLDFARTIEPGAYSAPAGDGYVVYAGTFLKSRSIDQLSRRFLEQGIKVHPEPVQVVRTLSRIRFGSFATQEDAAAAARELSNSGLKATVVKAK